MDESIGTCQDPGIFLTIFGELEEVSLGQITSTSHQTLPFGPFAQDNEPHWTFCGQLTHRVDESMLTLVRGKTPSDEQEFGVGAIVQVTKKSTTQCCITMMRTKIFMFDPKFNAHHALTPPGNQVLL
jgi:hypothetical protein